MVLSHDFYAPQHVAACLMGAAPAHGCGSGSLTAGTWPPTSQVWASAAPLLLTATPRPWRTPPRHMPSQRSPVAVCRTP